MATNIQAGRSYFGPDDRRLLVLSIDGDRVVVMHPTTLREEEMTLAEVQAWAAESVRRIYYPADYAARRVKLWTGTAADAAGANVAVYGPEQLWIEFEELERPGVKHRATYNEWTAWRRGLST